MRRRTAAVIIQKNFRGYRARQHYKQLLINSLDEMYSYDQVRFLQQQNTFHVQLTRSEFKPNPDLPLGFKT